MSAHQCPGICTIDVPILHLHTIYETINQPYTLQLVLHKCVYQQRCSLLTCNLGNEATTQFRQKTANGVKILVTCNTLKAARSRLVPAFDIKYSHSHF